MNLLITGAWKDAEKYIPELIRQGHIVSFMQFEQEALLVEYEWVEGIIGNGIFLFHDIKKFSSLKYIQLTSAGYDRIPMSYVTEQGIICNNARGVYSIPMAEFAVGSVLAFYKKVSQFYDQQRAHTWKKHRGLLELFGKTVCIVGCGSVGVECAKRFKAFDCKVVGFDVQIISNDCFDEICFSGSLDQALSQADIIILTVPLTDETYHLFNEQRFQMMKQDAVLVNISRGAVIDECALMDHIDNIGAVILDVFEEEPLSENSILWNHEKIVITPHNSFEGENDQQRLSSLILKNLERQGESNL